MAEKYLSAYKYTSKGAYQLWAHLYYHNAHRELLNTS